MSRVSPANVGGVKPAFCPASVRLVRTPVRTRLLENA